MIDLDTLIFVDIRDHSEIGVEWLGFFVVKRIEEVYYTFVHLAEPCKYFLKKAGTRPFHATKGQRADFTVRILWFMDLSRLQISQSVF
jgi:hypothetical protein